MATVTENRHLFGSLSVMENLVLGAYPRRARDAAPAGLARVLELFPRLPNVAVRRSAPSAAASSK